MLLVGPTGTGKTAYAQRYLMRLDPDRYTPPNFIGFSAQTSTGELTPYREWAGHFSLSCAHSYLHPHSRPISGMTQQLIDAKLDKRRKGVFGPPMGKRAVVFVDDLNMPQKETYGAQPPIELLRQFMDHSGWYDRDNLFRHMVDCQFVAAMGPPGGGRTFVTNRYTRHFSTLAITEPSRESLVHIFATIHAWFLSSRGFPSQVADLKDKVVAATMEVC